MVAMRQHVHAELIDVTVAAPTFKSVHPCAILLSTKDVRATINPEQHRTICGLTFSPTFRDVIGIMDPFLLRDAFET